MSETEQQQKHKKVCDDCGNGEFYFAKDLNLDKVWKAGNQFCRICTECGNRYFLSKAMYRAASDQYVILDGEDDPIPIFDCPNCDEQVTGQPDSCPYCDVEYEWPDSDDSGDEDSEESDADDHTDSEAETPESTETATTDA